MPIYDFTCKSCSKKFEELVFSDDMPACPHCQSGKTEKLVSSPCRSSSGCNTADAPTSRGGGCSGCSGSSCSTCGH